MKYLNADVPHPTTAKNPFFFDLSISGKSVLPCQKATALQYLLLLWNIDTAEDLYMKTLAVLVMVVFTTVSGFVCAQTDAKKVVEQMKFYEAEAEKLPASQIFKVLELEREDMHQKTQSGAAVWSLDEANIKAVGYASALSKRRAAGDAYAALYDGVYNTRVCRGLQLGSQGQQTSAISDCWQSSLAAFKIASTAGIADGARNVAIMYENGNGVVASKLVAAEWHVKAANQFLASGARDAAFISLEAALKLVPDHPEALRLKKNMLN
jgi:hypothetical protein